MMILREWQSSYELQPPVSGCMLDKGVVDKGKLDKNRETLCNTRSVCSR
jgi:hypothetical protein